MYNTSWKILYYLFQFLKNLKVNNKIQIVIKTDNIKMKSCKSEELLGLLIITEMLSFSGMHVVCSVGFYGIGSQEDRRN